MQSKYGTQNLFYGLSNTQTVLEPACRPAPPGRAAVRSTVRYRGTADATFILMKVIKCSWLLTLLVLAPVAFADEEDDEHTVCRQKAGSDETYCGACKTFIEQVTMRAAKTRSKRTRGAKALEKVIGSTSDGSVQWCMSSNEGEDTRFMDLNEAMSGGSSGSLSMSPEVNDILSSCFAEFGQGRNGEVIEQALTEASNVYEAPIPNYGGGTLNEAFCSKVARACPVKSLFDEEEETDEYGFADDEL